DDLVTGVQTCALPISCPAPATLLPSVSQALTVQVVDIDHDTLAVTWSINNVLQKTQNVAASGVPISVGFTHTYATGNYTVTVARSEERRVGKESEALG